MDKNLNILEISIPNYYSNKGKNRVIRKTENHIYPNVNLSRTSSKNNNSNIVRSTLPLNGIKSIKNINKTEEKVNPQIYLSPNSKVKIIGFLNQFNNNSIYYSNYKRGKINSNFGESKSNKEIQNSKNRLTFTEQKIKRSQNIFDLHKSANKIYGTKMLEDSKINESIEEKKNNYISSYKFFSNYNTSQEINKQYLQTNKKPETTKTKLLKIISKENIFCEEKNGTVVNSQKQLNNINMSNNKVKLKNNVNPEVINPGEYIKLKKIGEGSFGKIFKVKWIHNNKNYAMKEMHFQSEDNLLYLQKKYKFILDFQNKTKSNGLIKIFGYSCLKKKKDFYFYEIMELAERDWEQEINLRKKSLKYYTENELFSITKQLINALAFLQKNHITHRDIKLQNILVVNNKYKLCDFGESRSLNQKGVIVQPVRGSELYMSPILFNGLNQKKIQIIHNTYKSDIFSLGMCILFAATLGDDSLYEIREMNSMNNIRNVLRKYLSRKYSDNFIEILLCMLENKEKKRPDFIQMEKVISLYENIKINI